MKPSTTPTDDEPTRRRSSDEIRTRLILAALAEFSERGFDGASTRAIAERAGAHQPQINYHFQSKEELWRAAVDHLMDQFDLAFSGIDPSRPRDWLAETIRRLVRFAAERPELQRIMIQEGTSDSDRLTWLVERHVRPRHQLLTEAWGRAVEAGEAAPVSPLLIHYLIVGAATLLYANAPEARRLLDIEPTNTSLVELHGDTLVELLLPTPKED